jgi:hypothetical protein
MADPINGDSEFRRWVNHGVDITTVDNKSVGGVMAGTGEQFIPIRRGTGLVLVSRSAIVTIALHEEATEYDARTAETTKR